MVEEIGAAPQAEHVVRQLEGKVCRLAELARCGQVGKKPSKYPRKNPQQAQPHPLSTQIHLSEAVIKMLKKL